MRIRVAPPYVRYAAAVFLFMPHSLHLRTLFAAFFPEIHFHCANAVVLPHSFLIRFFFFRFRSRCFPVGRTRDAVVCALILF